MAGAPPWKVYNPDKRYVAACKYPEDAAAIAAAWGDGTTIRWGHRLVCWTEGQESAPASESYDTVAAVCHQRFLAGWRRRRRSSAMLKSEGIDLRNEKEELQ